MSNKHRIKGEAVSIAPRKMPPRFSRHGKPVNETFRFVRPAVTKIVTVFNPVTQEYMTTRKTVAEAIDRPMTEAEIEQARNSVKRATAPTLTYGKPNDGGRSAGIKRPKGVSK